MIGRWVIVIGLAAALGAPAQARQGDVPRRAVRILPAYLYTLPLPPSYPLADRAHRTPA